MIPDSQTNFLYLADSLPKKYPAFYQRFAQVLNHHHIRFGLLPGTNDIWAVDYMPVQTGTDEFVKFVYAPDYLRSKKWQKSISDANTICNSIGCPIMSSSLIVDGGNIVKASNKVIMCSKVFAENPAIPEKELIRSLHEALGADNIVFVPQQPGDAIGHADGMVRFLDDETVLINDHSKEKPDFQRDFRMALHNAGLKYIEIPYSPYHNRTALQANGIYINYLQMEKIIILPTFNIKQDDAVVKLFESLFNGHVITTIESNVIADNGGILNCISWNIKIQ